MRDVVINVRSERLDIMTLNIIHLPHRTDRWQSLQSELANQHITDYQIWDGIIDPELSCRGISRAHKRIIMEARNKGLSSVMIAEDDVKFTAPGAFAWYLEQQPTDFDLYLGGFIAGKIKEDYTINDFCGTHLYTIDRRFYDIILSAPESQNLDRSLTGKGKFRVCYPMVAIQYNGYSDNNQRIMDYSSFLKGKQFYG